MPGPWDPGLQNERTGLAWQRTVLSGLACSLLISRLVATVSITLAVTAGLLAMLGAAALWWMSILQFRRNSLALHASRPIGGGLAPLLLAVLLSLTATTALVYVAII